MKDPDAVPLPGRPQESATKGFGELEAEVIKAGACSECRACVDICTADGPEALELDLGRFTFHQDRCTGCGLCYAVCPEVPWAWEDLQERYEIEASEIGKERALSSAVTRSAIIKSRSADGGVVTSLLWYMLDTGQVDGAILAKADGPLGPTLFIARTRDEVLQAAGLRAGRGTSLATRLGVVTNLDMMGFLRRLYKDDPASAERLVLVGTPCQIHTLRRMQQVGVAPAPRVYASLGLFCYEALPLNKVQWHRFEEATGLRVEDVERIQMREELVLTMKDGRTKRIDLDTASLLAGPNCLRCTDFSNRFGDLSLGATGSDPGFTSVVVRTELGRALFEGAIEGGYVMEWTSVFDKEGGKDVAHRVRGRLVDQTHKKQELAKHAGKKAAA
ncbi:MAG: Coenzyme F420 hydrogenase/dehydrogenase, beta subunit C-terminal domain [Candidatus Thermoplasmatota archaeon]